MYKNLTEKETKMSKIKRVELFVFELILFTWMIGSFVYMLLAIHYNWEACLYLTPIIAVPFGGLLFIIDIALLTPKEDLL